MGAEIAESFPYDCQTSASASDSTKFDAEQTTMEVDTSSWHGDEAKTG
jgi:predicted metallo-beta-lactamase superfamily hydrolase